ncbi:NAD(P)/FAD-dependent oxidoreductase [Marinobacterium litorale]|uniref:NAD(P)/FAD-dependent oxidoreductase n=1 Tax=Marinobacterium litorale TaxID=404770 RepID=UPI00040AC3C9|nr:FAD-dependent oxidoreductase [Marinobacterium litorale]
MQRLVIVGGGHAAAQLIRTLHKRGFDGRITLVSDENMMPYNRPVLSKEYLNGQMEEDQIYLLQAAMYEKLGVEMRLGRRVERIDRDNRSVWLDSDERLDYDQLVLATGATPRRLDLPGSRLAGIHYLKTFDDARQLRERFQPDQHLTVIGGGYIGLEIASAARKMGLEVTLLERGPRILGRVVAPEVADYFHTLHIAQGVEIRTGTELTGFDGESSVEAVTLADGGRLATDHVVIGIGVEPADRLAQQAGMDCDNGILVDAGCRTSDPAIYAIGDCARQYQTHYGRWERLESVQNCNAHAAMLVAALQQRDAPAPEIPWFWSTQYDRRLQIAGLNQGYTEVIRRGSGEACSWLYLQDGCLIACDAINRPADFLQAKKLIAAKTQMDRQRSQDPSLSLNNCAC